jgi:hypothetical protein
MRTLRRLSLTAVLAVAGPALPGARLGAQSEALPPAGLGSLRQDDLAIRLRTSDIEVRFVPLDFRVTRLLARDAYESLRGLVESRRHAIDSLASAAGVSQPGLALVTFFGQQAGARFDPQTLTITVRNHVFYPLGIVPFTPRFTSQQLGVREQATGIYLYEESIPVTDDFFISYNGQDSDNWARKRGTLDRERARVSSRARAQPQDSLGEGGAR